MQVHFSNHIFPFNLHKFNCVIFILQFLIDCCVDSCMIKGTEIKYCFVELLLNNPGQVVENPH